ncbi:acyl-CoA dehydrogenase family protein [Nocardioides pantholopis]|uniref:acyl-CoA dehydrogenase family protein n=1 Tax=Nocardioides pantholopis TaxID=2483798 RepID=UPI000F0803D0|nr:acyl-CoA dehydrogenase family protein [Nocardioides pantholopis]
MDHELDPELRALREMCTAFAQKEIAPHAAEWSRVGEVPPQLFHAMGDLGLMGMLIDPEHGGSGAGYLAYVTAMEEIGRADQSVAAAWNAHSTIGSLPLASFGSPEQKERWLRPLAEGRALAAFGLTEPGAGSDAAGITTRAQRTAEGWVINGTKMFISNAGTPISQGVTLLARTGEPGSREFGVFYVPTGTPGYRQGRKLEKLGWHALDTRELVFEDCVVAEDHLIGDAGAGLQQFLAVLDGGRISVAALSLSLAQAALDLALAHAAGRRQFGRPIADFQAVRHHLATMATEVAAARGLVYRAAWLADQGLSFSQEAAMAKLYASEVANRAASTSVQIHGGYGYILESEISRFFADAKILEIGEGTNEIQRDVIARDLLRSAGPRSA